MLEESRFSWPRRGLVHHPLKWYLSEAPLARPVFGVYALAALAEDMMWKARFGKHRKRPTLAEAAGFFAFSRRALQNVLSSHPVGKRLAPASLRAVRAVAGKLVGAARELVEKIESRVLTPTPAL